MVFAFIIGLENLSQNKGRKGKHWKENKKLTANVYIDRRNMKETYDILADKSGRESSTRMPLCQFNYVLLDQLVIVLRVKIYF